MECMKYLLTAISIICLTNHVTLNRLEVNHSNEVTWIGVRELFQNRPNYTTIKATGVAITGYSKPLVRLLSKHMGKRIHIQEEPNDVGISTVIDDDEDCKLELCKKCISLFRHDVYTSEANFVYLKLNPASGVTIRGRKQIVGEDLWVWTFSGKEGGFGFLKWPIEFGIWSMGLLTSYALTTPQDIIIKKVSGNCSNLEVGRPKDDKIISNALLNLTLEMMELSEEKYAPSYFCYKRRKIIKTDLLYTFCKHIVCPLEALEYVCCSYYYEVPLQKRALTCDFPKRVIEYETVGWILPIIVSMVLFVYFPLFLLYSAHILFDQNEGYPITVSETNSLEVHESISLSDKIIWLNEHAHVTLFKTLFSPIRKCREFFVSKETGPCQFVLKRFKRIFLPCLSLLVIGLQVCIDFWFLHSFVLTSVNKGVPMGFRSLIVGYRDSKENFLPYLGGPYIAIGSYLFITSILIIIPDNLSSLLISGLPGNDVNESVSPLCIRSRSIEHFGSVCIRKKHNYLKLYSVFLAQFYMFINSRYWKHMFRVQKARWQYFYCSKICVVFFPFYIIICTIEIFLCIVVYGFPVVSFGLTIIKAYCGKLNMSQRRRFCVKTLYIFVAIILIACVFFFLHMFCTIFMDATLFFTRLVFFTFTGVVVYPKVSYGYLIFTLTVIYYLWQSIQDFSLVYQDLLKDTISICFSLQRADGTDFLVTQKGDFRGVRESLFEHVIENNIPKRKQVFISLFKVAIILTVLGLLINILIETDGFRQLQTIVQVGTALFICSLPQILKMMCHGHGGKFKQRRFRRELTSTIINYVGNNMESAESSNSDD
ncbi:uncharacterized protein LOC123566118 [Mercenaria mercenaria]|uniref:uncharacterized protein LOC123566118 n=1 Tax=Mercenaria mercenaria TaxID=6596 RepID=UPI00234E647B|nr:uncharacterized protein LOC123566118 [Mercenaria mercenaria]